MDFINFKCSNGYSEPCWSTHLPFPVSSLSSPTPANSNMMETQNVMQIMSVGWGNNIVFRYSTVSRLGFFFFWKVSGEIGRRSLEYFLTHSVFK